MQHFNATVNATYCNKGLSYIHLRIATVLRTTCCTSWSILLQNVENFGMLNMLQNVCNMLGATMLHYCVDCCVRLAGSLHETSSLATFDISVDFPHAFVSQ